MRPIIKNSNFKHCNYIKRISGLIRLNVGRLVCVVNWKTWIDFIKKVAKELAKKWKNYKESVAKKQIEPDTGELTNCPCNRTVSHLWTQIQDLQNNSLSDAREFHDLETASSSGALHVPIQPLTIPSPRGMPSRDSGLPHDTQNIMGTSGNVFESLPAREGPSSALFENSRNLAPSSRGLRPGITATLWYRREK